MIRASLMSITVVFAVFWSAIPAAPQAPQDTDAPFVESVSFYKDWRLTQPIDTAIAPGTTIYTKIVFSEPMKLKVADDNTARPVLYYQVGGERIRYRIARRGAGGADFVSGDAKPLRGGTDDYICKFTLPEGATGKITTMVGRLSTDRSGNTMERFYTHPVRLTLRNEAIPLPMNTSGRNPNTPQPVNPPIDPLLDTSTEYPGGTPIDSETLVELMDTTDLLPVAEATPRDAPRDEAFFFRKFLELLLVDLKAGIPIPISNFDYDPETIFQTPGKGFIIPSRAQFGGSYGYRQMNFRWLEIFVPDVLTTATVRQVNKFSAEYKLTRDELIKLLRNLRHAGILVFNIEFIWVFMPDENLRKVVVAKINELGISMTGTPKKTTPPIYSGEMSRIKSLAAEEAGVQSLIGLEYAKDLEQLHFANYYRKVSESVIPNRISDLTPLKDLTNLTYIDLRWNAVKDLAPLRNLTNLITLGLERNAVENLAPLRNLTNLTSLYLHENKVTDISPLANLTNLRALLLENDYYGFGTGDNEINDLTPLRNLINLEELRVGLNPIGSSIGVVRNFPKLKGLGIGCCGVSNLRPLVAAPGLREAGSWVYLVYSPLTEEDFPDLAVLRARGVDVEDGLLWLYNHKGEKLEFLGNQVEKCSESFRAAILAAPALHPRLGTEIDVLSSLWHDLSQIPEETALLTNYPNPFNPETWIPYQLATPAEVTMAIHAADGRLVCTLALGYQPAGVYKSKGRAAYWDGRNAQGEPVASGVYFYTLSAGNFTATRKLLIQK